MAASSGCRGLGVTVTALSVMMKTNYRRLAEIRRWPSARRQLSSQRLPAVEDRPFTLTYEEFWEGFRRLLAATRLVSTTEPILNAMLGVPGLATGCGRSTVRLAPDGRILPCTYWPASRLTLADLDALGEGITSTREFQEATERPAACANCPCLGGCAGRRAVLGRLGEPDPYCPFARGERLVIDWESAVGADLPKLGSACTTVVSAR